METVAAEQAVSLVPAAAVARQVPLSGKLATVVEAAKWTCYCKPKPLRHMMNDEMCVTTLPQQEAGN